jgi:hypothetical protein
MFQVTGAVTEFDRSILKTLHLVPDVVPEKDLFDDFLSLKDALPRVLANIGR